MIAGFVALMIAHSRVLPFSVALYSTESRCQTAISQQQPKYPKTPLLCGEVMRGSYM
ncbi:MULTISPECIES: hypothetical protein [Tatumella]|uniref:Uncharacterized protein n=1 Tax=Tatumella punctata TaxID=399969 RepID=A0ABW1VRL6_9GAMM|nr:MULTISPECIES: hypothetical protein [unclassified Tatumella]MBS0856022.1 hypothetical protein [Tatumella sp. JGM16]MBS0878081.1 hypothetical protein [Tatumella sp. JGM82]MBS0890440.1 hypothetical protein [Tatumella sp. JGM94]MBS0894671.1 hypothetical protein [Tatumella sp. JGM130]MBS0900896.1 hypothetical protein [Tatumella sp. JGM100]